MNTYALVYMVGKMEKELQKYMPKEEYIEFLMETSREAFKVEVEHMEDGEFKKYILDNFSEIVGEN